MEHENAEDAALVLYDNDDLAEMETLHKSLMSPEEEKNKTQPEENKNEKQRVFTTDKNANIESSKHTLPKVNENGGSKVTPFNKKNVSWKLNPYMQSSNFKNNQKSQGNHDYNYVSGRQPGDRNDGRQRQFSQQRVNNAPQLQQQKELSYRCSKQPNYQAGLPSANTKLFQDLQSTGNAFLPLQHQNLLSVNQNQPDFRNLFQQQQLLQQQPRSQPFMPTTHSSLQQQATQSSYNNMALNQLPITLTDSANIVALNADQRLNILNTPMAKPFNFLQLSNGQWIDLGNISLNNNLNATHISTNNSTTALDTNPDFGIPISTTHMPSAQQSNILNNDTFTKVYEVKNSTVVTPFQNAVGAHENNRLKVGAVFDLSNAAVCLGNSYNITLENTVGAQQSRHLNDATMLDFTNTAGNINSSNSNKNIPNKPQVNLATRTFENAIDYETGFSYAIVDGYTDACETNMPATTSVVEINSTERISNFNVGSDVGKAGPENVAPDGTTEHVINFANKVNSIENNENVAAEGIRQSLGDFLEKATESDDMLFLNSNFDDLSDVINSDIQNDCSMKTLNKTLTASAVTSSEVNAGVCGTRPQTVADVLNLTNKEICGPLTMQMMDKVRDLAKQMKDEESKKKN